MKNIKVIISDFDQTLLDTKSVGALRAQSGKIKEVVSIAKNFELYHGWREVFEGLKERKITFGILSHGTKSYLEPLLKRNKVPAEFLLSRYGLFQKWPNLKPVPKSELLEQSLQLPIMQDIKREEILYIGDQANDISQAHKFGCRAAACIWDTEDKLENIFAQNPDLVLNHPTDILRAV